MSLFAWPKSAVEIVNDIDDQMDIQWDTDSNICILTGFIEEHCDPAQFAAYVQRCAEDERRNTEASQ